MSQSKSRTARTDNKIRSLEEAVEELAQSFGFEAHYRFQIDGEEFVITYKQFLPAPIQLALDAVDVALEDCDKDDAGDYLIPLRRGGKLLDEPRDALRLRVLWGNDKYERFHAAGGSPDLLSIVWMRQETDLQKYQKSL